MASQPRIRRDAAYPVPVALAAAESCSRMRLRRVAVAAAALAAAAMLALGGAAAYAASQPTCGLEEHEHTSACYEGVLACGYEEGEELEDGSAHEHSEECYTQELSCGLAEHAHDESCYPEQAEVLETLVAAVTGEDAEESGSAAAADEDADEDETFNGYIDAESISVDMADGYGALDAVEYDDDGNAAEDEAGNDSSTSNGTVRTFDDVVYTFGMNAVLRDASAASSMGSATFYMQAMLGMDIYQARFDVEKMTWCYSTGNWKIEYLDEDGSIVLTETASGLTAADGTSVSSLNEYVGNASDEGADVVTLESTYGSNVCSMRLVAWLTMTTDSAAIEMQNWQCFVRPLACENGEMLAPSFAFWLEGNENNVNATGLQESAVLDISEDDTDSADEDGDGYAVKVTCAERYNVYITGPTTLYNSEGRYYDFNTGQRADESSDTTLWGAMGIYLIELMLFNETPDEDVLSLSDKGLMGCAIPCGDITVTLSMSAEEQRNDSDTDSACKFVLWDYSENGSSSGITPNSTGKWERVINFSSSSNWNNYQVGFTNSSGKTTYSTYDCYMGGSVTSASCSDGTEKTSATTAGSTTYTFTFSGYDFDFDDWHFPSYTSLDGKSYTGSFTSMAFLGLSAWFTAVVSEDIDCAIRTTASVDNLTIAGTSTEGAKRCTADKTGGGAAASSNDNSASRTYSTYAAVSAAEYMGFSSWNGSYTNGTFGTISNKYSAWGVYGSYGFQDASYTTFSSGSSGLWLKDVNFLMLMDTEALEIDTTTDRGLDNTSQSVGDDGTKGTCTYLYAADPLYPQGYDSTDEKVAQRMDDVGASDMLYFESLEDCEDAGFVCVGVMFELRDVTTSSATLSFAIPFQVRTYTRSSEIAATAADGTVDESKLEFVSTDECVCVTADVEEFASLDSETNPLGTLTWKDAKVTADNYGDYLDEDGIENYLTDDEGDEVVFSDLGDWYYHYDAMPASSQRNKFLPCAYATGVDVEVENVSTGASSAEADVAFNVTNDERYAQYTLDVSAVTRAEVDVTADLEVAFAVDEEVLLEADTFSLVFGDEEYELSVVLNESSAETTDVSIEYDGEEYDVSVKTVLSSDRTSVKFLIYGLPTNASVQLVFEGYLTGVVENGQSYEAEVNATGTEDNRTQGTSYGNYDTVDFDVVSLELVGIQETAAASVAEYGDEVSYDLVVKSISDTAATDITLMDVLPYLDDEAASSLASGSYELVSVSLSFVDAQDTYEAVEEDGVKLYVSSDEDVRDYTERTTTENEDGSVTTVSKMADVLTTELTEVSDSSWEDSDGGSWFACSLETSADDDDATTLTWQADDDMGSTALYVYLPDLCAHETVTITVTLDPVAKDEAAEEDPYEKTGDTYANMFYKARIGGVASISSNIATTQVAKRTIAGTVWEDADYDGVYDEGELLLSDVDVSLYRTDASSFDSDGTGYPQLKGVSGSDGETLAGLNSSGQLYAAYDVYGNVLAAEDVYKSRAGVVTTDETGGYCFDDLEAGTYLVVIYADEYAESYVATVQDAGSDDSSDSDFAAATGSVVVGPDYSCDLLASSSLELPTAEELDEDGAGALYEVADVDAGLVSTGTFSFTKTDSASSSEALSGAVFALYAWTGSGSADTSSLVSYDASDDYASTSENWTLIATATSDESGVVALAGGLLPGDELRLVEVVAPGGYVRPAGQWALTVASTSAGVASVEIGTAVYEQDAQMPLAFGVYDEDAGAATEYYLPNRAATVLPSSGGTWPWLVGVALLALAAAVALAGRSRRGAHSRR